MSLCDLKQKGVLSVVSQHKPRTMDGILFLEKLHAVLDSSNAKQVPTAV